MATLTSNDMTYRLWKMSVYIATFGDKVAREFLNGNSCAKSDFKKLAHLVMLHKITKCYITSSSVFILENGSENDNILLESNDCLLEEVQ